MFFLNLNLKDTFLTEGLLKIFIHFNKLDFPEVSSHCSVLLQWLDAELSDAWSRLCDWGHRQRTMWLNTPFEGFLQDLKKNYLSLKKGK